MSFAQNPPGDSCPNAQPFCSDITGNLQFSNRTKGFTAPIGCLVGTDNGPSMWFFLRISQAGILNFRIQQWVDANGNGIADDGVDNDLDVDFIAWGPFGDSNNITNCPTMNGNNDIACSFSAEAIENFNINNAQVGEFYYLLITNFAASFGDDRDGLIQIQQTNLGQPGAGSTDCSIVSGNLGPDQNLCVGEEVTLDGTTEGATSFEWQLDPTPNNGIDNFAPIAGAINPMLTINNNVSGIYRVIVSDGVTFDSDDVVIAFSTVPTATEPATGIETCDTDNNGFFTFDLTEKEAEIRDGQAAADFTVSYHLTQMDADDGTNPIADPTSHENTVINMETIFVRIENVDNEDCFDTTSFDIEVFDTPTATEPATGIEICDTDNNGFFTFDLTAKEAEIRDGQAAADFTVSYHLTQIDADDGTNPIADPTSHENTVINMETIFVRIENVDNEDCFDTTSFDIEVFDTPTATQPATGIDICDTDNNGFFTFDLTAKEAEIRDGQTAADFTVSYHLTQIDADDGTNPIADPTSHENTVINMETIFVRIENVDNEDCFDTTSFDIEVFDTPTATEPATGIEICDTDNNGFFTFDLTAKEAEIRDGQAAADFTVSYHLTQMDADDGTNPIADPTSHENTVINMETIFVRIENVDNEDCFDTTSFDIEVFDTPTATQPATGIDICDTDNNGFFTFDLTAKEAEIRDGQAAADFSVSYHLTQIDADDGTNPIADPTSHENTVINMETIFVRIENVDNEDCFDTTSFDIEVFDTPTATEPATGIEICDTDNNGFFTFDLTAKEAEIRDGQAAADFTVSYHLTQMDADDGTNPIADPTSHENTVINMETIFVRIENVDNEDCFDTTSFDIEVFDTPTATQPATGIEICDTDNNGFFTFDLTAKEAEIRDGQAAADFTVSYHLTQMDADDGTNPIADPTSHENTVINMETIFVRIENVDNEDCFDTTSFDIEVFDTPDAVDIQFPLVTCSAASTADFDLTTDATPQIINGNMDWDVSYFEDMDLTIPIANPGNYTSATIRIFALVEDPTNNNCSDVAVVDLIVLAEPESRDQSIEECSSTGMAEFDITSVEADIINGAPNVDVTYHTSFADADGGLMPITGDLTKYNAATSTVFARSLGTYQAGNCDNVSEISLVVLDNPLANYVLYPECNAQNQAEFDLTTIEAKITGNSMNRIVTFFPSLTDAEMNNTANELSKNLTSSSTTIFARVDDPQNMCFSTTSIDLEVVLNPVFPEELVFITCFRNDIATFDLGAEKAMLELSYPNFEFSFYETMADADIGGIALPNLYEALPKTIHIRIQLRNGSCYSLDTAQLEVEAVPETELEDIICIGTGYLLPDGTIANASDLYDITIIDPETGCDIRYLIDLTVGEIEFPSAFTPNGNGQNDVFGALPSAVCAGLVNEYRLQVWNRWGEKVFETTDYGTSWEGNFNGYAAQAGVYLYRVEFVFQGERTERDGTISLLR